MKKLFIAVTVLFILGLAGIYIFFPAKTTISRSIIIETSESGIDRYLLWKKGWQAWWPGRYDKADSSNFQFQGLNFALQEGRVSGMPLTISYKGIQFESEAGFFALDNNTARVTWAATHETGWNPVDRIRQYQTSKTVEHTTTELLRILKKYLQDETHIYGIKVKVSLMQDSFMVVNQAITPAYPSMQKVYSLIEQAKMAAAGQQAKVTNYPMLNVRETDDHRYQINVAVPINKAIRTAGNMKLNKMVTGGNRLECTVRGGTGKTGTAIVQLKQYISNHRLISPAMPYEQLVTNRLTEPDTAKWVTRIFYPIF